jgi:proteasome assembly chaperone (PAC2) family protein
MSPEILGFSMNNEVWIESYSKIDLNEPIAIVGSPGLRSIGELVVDRLIKETNAYLFASLYSKHIPLIYQTNPSYASNPGLPGIGGIKVQSGKMDFPKVEFFASSFPPLIIARGRHANFDGQYDIAERVVDFFKESQVKRMIVVAGYGLKEGTHKLKVCCAATKESLMNEMKEKFNIEVDYNGPFYGFSGLVFGIAKMKNIEAICLLAGTLTVPEKPEFADENSCKIAFDTLARVIPVKGHKFIKSKS